MELQQLSLLWSTNVPNLPPEFKHPVHLFVLLQREKWLFFDFRGGGACEGISAAPQKDEGRPHELRVHEILLSSIVK